MKVSKEIFYHANSGNEVKIGDILVFNDNTHNRMYNEIYNNEYKLDEKDANELLVNKKKNKDTNLSIEEFETILNTVNNDSYVIRELALEEIRKNKYKNYPSRLNCLYVTKEKEDAMNWSDILKRNKKICKQILTLELNGELFVGDGNLIKRKNLSYQNHLNNAEKYWNSKNPTIPEYLFYGKATVIDIDNME